MPSSIQLTLVQYIMHITLTGPGVIDHAGSFAVVASQVLWLAAFFAGLVACAVGITYPAQPSAQALPDECTAGVSIFNQLYLSCFAAVISCTAQASCATLAMYILGSRKRIEKLPPPSGMWCRRFLLLGVVFCGVSFSFLICVLDLFIFVRVARFACLGWVAKVLVVAADAVAAMWGVAIFAAGSYISLFCH